MINKERSFKNSKGKINWTTWRQMPSTKLEMMHMVHVVFVYSHRKFLRNVASPLILKSILYNLIGTNNIFRYWGILVIINNRKSSCMSYIVISVINCVSKELDKQTMIEWSREWLSGLSHCLWSEVMWFNSRNVLRSNFLVQLAHHSLLSHMISCARNSGFFD